jgi:hypothetical protein
VLCRPSGYSPSTGTWHRSCSKSVVAHATERRSRRHLQFPRQRTRPRLRFRAWVLGGTYRLIVLTLVGAFVTLGSGITYTNHPDTALVIIGLAMLPTGVAMLIIGVIAQGVKVGVRHGGHRLD